MNKLIKFCKEVYDPGVHLYFALNWYVALHLGLSLNHDKAVAFSIDSFVAIITLFIVLFYLRVIDELKDFDYDQKFNTDRPLVRGLVQKNDLFLYCGISALMSLVLNIKFGFLPLLIILIDLVYSTLLIWIEKTFVSIKDNMLLNLIFTYPVNVLLSLYILFLNLTLWQENVLIQDTLLVVAFAAAFLYYEFGRKILWPHQELPGQRTYSSFFGTIPSVIIAETLALTGMGLLIYLYHSLVPLILLLPLLSGLQKFANKEKKFPLKMSGSIYIGLFYGTIIFLGLKSVLF